MDRRCESGSAWPPANPSIAVTTCSVSTVNLASRICDAADGGQILVSDVVQDLGGPLGFRFLEAGLRTLKGFQEPSALFELQRDRAR